MIYRLWPKLEVCKFIATGILSISIDYLVYNVIFNWVGVDRAKIIGFISGSICSFIFNKNWTFKSKGKGKTKKQIKLFIALYIATLVANVVTNDIALTATTLLGYTKHNLSLAFLVATMTSAILNYYGMKNLVFR